MNDITQNASDWPPKMAVCIGTVVLRGEQVLFVRQAPGTSLSGRWSIPWGVVDPGESPEVAALRETREEGGVTAEIEGLLGFQNLQPGWIGIVFLCRHIDGEPTPDGVETDRATYMSLEQLGAVDEPLEPWCRWLARRVLRGECRVIPPEPDNPYQPRLAYL